MEINDKLKLIREHTGESQAKFAKRFSIPQQTYANYELNKRNIPDDFKMKLYRDLNVDLNWLVTGEGAMFRNGSTEGQATGGESPPGANGPDYSLFDRCTQLIPMTNLSLSAGHGVEWGSGEYTGELMPIPKDIYRRFKSYDLAGARVKGDSMEPTLKDGEPVVYAMGAIEGDGIYVISILDELFVKRLSRNILDQTVTIISDNTLYPPVVYSVDREGLEILGKVVFWLHMEK